MSAPLSMSFRTDEQYMAESQDGWNNQWGSVFGGVGQSGEGRLTDYYKAHCPLHQFTPENKDQYSSVHWFLTCGDDEQQLLIANDDLHVMMRRNGYAHQYRVEDGAHTASYWKAALNEVLPYFSALMAGTDEAAWQMTLKTPEVPAGVTFAENNVFPSEAYTAGGKAEGIALFFAYEGLDEATVKDALAILQRRISQEKKFVLIPCDLDRKTIREWVSYYQDIYPATEKQALAIGKAGKEVFEAQQLFTALYFDNAALPAQITIDKDRYYYIGQNDGDSNYASTNALYKACKLGGAEFQYRCRNRLDDEKTDLLTGIEYVKSNLKHF
jgi:hypothetical protein